MTSSFETLQTRERLAVGQRFLTLRPQIVALGACGNAALLARSGAPALQKAVLAAALGATVLCFFVEAAWLRRHPLSERWLATSLALTLCVLALGALLSGGLSSPLLPLLPTPVVVGFAAFGRARPSFALFSLALCLLLLLALLGPLSGFPLPSAPWLGHMLLLSALLSLLLVAVGVTGLVDAHGRVSAKLEQMRSDVLAEAEQRAASLEQLGAQVAHEVKNPLTAVRGLVQLLERKAPDERDRQRFAVVITEVDRALTLLKSYLTLSKPLTALTLAEVDLRAVLEDLAGVLEARAAERNVKLQLEGEQVTLLADRRRLRDALLNLALNSLAAMPNGGTLWLAVAQRDGVVRVTVEDDGVGMDEHLVARLGRPFTSETEDGNGLGVPIARAVARQHGGELEFRSAVGEGTRAVLVFPPPRAN